MKPRNRKDKRPKKGTAEVKVSLVQDPPKEISEGVDPWEVALDYLRNIHTKKHKK